MQHSQAGVINLEHGLELLNHCYEGRVATLEDQNLLGCIAVECHCCLCPQKECDIVTTKSPIYMALEKTSISAVYCICDHGLTFMAVILEDQEYYPNLLCDS